MPPSLSPLLNPSGPRPTVTANTPGRSQNSDSASRLGMVVKTQEDGTVQRVALSVDKGAIAEEHQQRRTAKVHRRAVAKRVGRVRNTAEQPKVDVVLQRYRTQNRVAGWHVCPYELNLVVSLESDLNVAALSNCQFSGRTQLGQDVAQSRIRPQGGQDSLHIHQGYPGNGEDQKNYYIDLDHTGTRLTKPIC